MMTSVADMRQPYHGTDSTYDLGDLTSMDPMEQFKVWFEEVKSSGKVLEPNAMSVATATSDGFPSLRMMLLKGFDANGFVFFTNYNSRKGRELTENPQCALMLYWEPIKRSVRIEGKVEKLTEESSIEYFNSRPKDSRVGAVVSRQSSVIESRKALTEKFEELEELYKDTNDVPKPDHWGGYLVRPEVMEFWQGQTNRLHDRLRFRKLKSGEKFDERTMHKGESDWIIERLSA